MKHSSIIPLLCLLSPLGVSAANLPDLDASQLSERVAFAHYLEGEVTRAKVAELSPQLQSIIKDWSGQRDAFIANLPTLQEQPLPPEPEPCDDTIVDSTEDMFFNSEKSMISYFGEVRLRDPRLHLNCKRLYLQLEQKRVQEESTELSSAMNLEMGVTHSTGAQASGGMDLSPSQDAQQNAVMRREKDTTPVSMDAQEVLIDMKEKWVFAVGDLIEIKHSKGEIRANGGQPFALIADNEGLIYVSGEQIEGFTINEEGERSEFYTEGYVLFVLESDSLMLAKNNRIQMPQAQIECSGLLRMRLLADENQGETKEGKLKLNRAYKGLSYVSGVDDVIVTGTHRDGSPFELKGDLLSYDAKIGEFVMTGEQCDLAFGEQNMSSVGDATARLYADGSFKIHGADISGNYQRQARTSDSLMMGQFQTRKELYMSADDGKLYFPHGLKAQDAEMDFTCSREIVAEFEREEPEAQSAQNTGAVLPDFQFSRIKGLSKVHASGDIVAKGLGEFDAYMQGDELDADLIEGTARIQAKPAQWAQFTYQGAQLKARSQEKAADLQLLPNGDVLVLGDYIEGYMPAREGKSSASFETQNRMFLQDAQSLLVVEDPVRMQTEQGLFISPSGVTAKLRRDMTEVGDSSSESAGFARHHFNYTGVEQAESKAGGSFQSDQFSMQCDGLMQVFMDEAGKVGKDPMLASVKRAVANDFVRFVVKDGNGDLYRATGDKLTIDGAEGTKLLTGSRVTLNSGTKAHEASGKGAQVLVDAKNNVRLSGEYQTSVVVDIQEQMSREGKEESKKNKTQTSKQTKP